MAKLKQHLGRRGPLRWPLRSFLRLFVFNVFIFHFTHNTWVSCCALRWGQRSSRGSSCCWQPLFHPLFLLPFSFVSWHQQQHHHHNMHITSEPSNIYIILLHLGVNKTNKAAHLYGKHLSCSLHPTTRWAVRKHRSSLYLCVLTVCKSPAENIQWMFWEF